MGIIWTTISYAAFALAQQGEPVKPAVEATPALAGCYDSKESQEQAEAAGQVAPIPPVPPGTVPVALTAAEQFLTELETADQGLRTLRTGIQYDRVFELQGDRQTWEGTLLYQSREPIQAAANASAAPIRKFMVQFDRSKIGEQVNDMDKKSFMFDGRWFVERNERLKTISKREVFREGEATDPMRLGDSPFPLPIGQKMADILERYEVELLDANDGLEAHEPEELPRLRAFVAGCKQLLLKPKPLENQRVTIVLNEVRLWYRPAQVEGANGATFERWLPRMARTENKEGVTIVQLIKPVVNQAVTDADFVLQGGEGWLVQEDRLEQ